MTELLAFAATYALHSTALIGVVLVTTRFLDPRSIELRELLLRAALFGSVLTATVATVAANGHLEGRPDSPAAAQRSVVSRAPSVRADARVDGPSTAPAANELLPATASSMPSVAAAKALPEPQADVPTTLQRAAFELPRFGTWLERSLLVLWLTGTTFGLARLAQSVRAQRAVAAALPRLDPTPAERALARRLGVTHFELVLDEGADGPYVASSRLIALPGWAIALESAQRLALLAHEFAHLVRRDATRLVVIEAVRRAFWFQPLNRVAQSRLDALAELSCDARAAYALGDGRSLALCLAACAEQVATAHPPRFVPAMARNRSLFLSRVQRLLEDAPMSPRSLLSWKVLLPVAVCTLAFLLPTVLFRAAMAEGAFDEGDGSIHSMTVQESGGHRTTRFRDSDLGMDATIEGDITFADDDSDVTSLTGSATLEEIVNGVEHRMDFRNEGGKVVRRYRVDGKEQPIDANARAWLAKAVPTLLRNSAIDAEKRVARLYARGGTDAVLDDVDQVRTDYARREYLVALAGIAKLSPPELDRVIAIVDRMRSDYERRTAYQGLLETQRFSPAQQAALLQGVARMGSDFEQRTVLVAMVPQLSGEAEVASAWNAALDAITSDFELRTVLESAASLAMSEPMAASMLAATRHIGSDFEQRTALVSLLHQIDAHPALIPAWIAATERISSDFERRSALEALMDGRKLDADGYSRVLRATGGIGSDFERRTVLEHVARAMPADEKLVQEYRAVARELGDYEQSQAMAALGRRVD